MKQDVKITFADVEKKIIKSISGEGILVVPPTVEDLADCGDYSVLSRDQFSSIVFSEGCTKIGSNWNLGYFETLEDNDSSLKEITLPSTMQEVNSSFDEYDDLQVVWIPEGMIDHFQKILPQRLAALIQEPGIVAQDGCKYSKDGKILFEAPRDIKECFVMPGCEVIDTAFGRTNQKSACEKLESLVLPEGVHTIKPYAFWECEKLTRVVLPKSLTTIGQNAFYDCKSLREIIIPSGVVKLYDFDGCRNLMSVELPDTLTSIGGFNHTDFLSSLRIPTSVVSIDYMAFRWCGLCELTIPGNVKHIGHACFYKSPNLCRVMMDDGVEELEGCFGDCEKLKYVVLPQTIKMIDREAFEGSNPIFFVPVGSAKRFKQLLPKNADIREGNVPEELEKEVTELIPKFIADAIAEQAKELATDFIPDKKNASWLISKALDIFPDNEEYKQLEEEINNIEEYDDDEFLDKLLDEL